MSIYNTKIIGEEPLPNPKWLKLDLVYYTDPLGVKRDWERCSRQTRVEGKDCDSVAILATFIHSESKQKHILLQKQFRVAAGGVCVELPAGLLDPNETIEQCAERELHEETGYVGRALSASPLIFNDPGFCNCNMKLVDVEIDMQDEKNRNPQPQLEDNEFIDTFSVELRQLPEIVDSLAAKGDLIDARVASIARGIQIARNL